MKKCKEGIGWDACIPSKRPDANPQSARRPHFPFVNLPLLQMVEERCVNAHREIHDYANRLSYRVVEEEGAGLGPVTHTTQMLFLGINGEAYSQT